MKSFEAQVYGNISKSANISMDLLKRSSGVRSVVAMQDGSYKVTLSGSSHVASNDSPRHRVARILSNDPLNGKLRLQPDLLTFEPEEELIFKSSGPLWGLESDGSNTVIVKRLF